ncbi:MAG: efflux RND transporter periplasmic adaptor subunit, partial [Myxococcota bacterium]|nr:efflux RND transporter periplasmic adaptor subunit [Myxococcota bacterium]
VTQARAQLSSSQSQLGDATVRAPMTGVVARRSVGAGDVVSPGAALYEIIDPSTMRLDAAVASGDLSAIGVGKPVGFSVRGYPDQRFEGTIARIAPAADPVTRQIQVLVEIPNPGGKLVAGLYAEGRVAVEQREGLIVPLAVLDLSGDQPSVLRVNNGVIERSVVALGLRDERAEIVEVTNGIAAGDVLLLARAGKTIVPGSKVELPPDVAGTGSGGGAAPPASGSGATTRPAVGSGAAPSKAAAGPNPPSGEQR